jgi:chemotaxis protein methyltransferase CheR
MRSALPDGLLSRLSEFVDARMALHFPSSRWSELGSKAAAAAEELGCADPESFIEGLIATQATSEQMDTLVSHLTIGETYFWREPQAFDALEGAILPELIRSRRGVDRRLRIWCAGCSTGEEAYSIAIALRRTLPEIDDWNVSILATDINPRTLRKAEAGLYGEWSFRNAPPWLTERFFRQKKDETREVLPEIRKMVSFSYLNLAEDAYPSSLNDTSAMDLIFCRNVLMYFKPERARRIVEGLGRSLVEGGWLMTGACEHSQLLFSGFAPIQFPGAIVYRKSAIPPRSMEPPLRGEARVQETPARRLPEPRAAIAKHRAAPKPLIEATPPAISSPPSPASSPAIRELADQGRLSEALALCVTAIADKKLDPRLRYLKATILQELNRGDEAIASLKQAIYLDPDYLLAHFTLGNLALRSGDARTGRRCFKNTLSLLAARDDGDILPESEGLTAGRFREIISATMRIGALV